MTPASIDLSALSPDEAHVARNAVCAHRRNRQRVQAQAAFFEAVLARYHERPTALRLTHPDDTMPVLVFGAGPGRVEEQMPDDLADLYRAWKSA